MFNAMLNYALAMLCLASIVKNSLVVRSPKELVQKFENATLKTSLSNFGKIPYGYQLLGRVFYNPVADNVNYACSNLTNIGEDHSVDESPIIMVERGDCTFVTKVRNVQNAGGHVALIIDNTEEDVDYIVMADDGRGREITIPGVLISKADGKKLVDFYRDFPEKRNHIRLEVNFEMENDNYVKWHFYTTSDNDVTYRTMSDFYPYYAELKDNINFTAHYITYQHPLYNTISHDQNVIQANCLGRGKYCNQPGKFGVTDGREIVHVSIKQKCVYKFAYEEANDPILYWDYMTEFYSSCLNITNPKFNRECSQAAARNTGIPIGEINECIRDSFIATDEQKTQDNYELYYENTLLNMDNEDRNTYKQSFIPSITVNDRTFWGNWVASNIFEAICAGFNKKPEICYSEGAFNKNEGMSTFSVILIIILAIGINIVIFIYCKRFIQRKISERIESTDINHKINTVVTSYLALRETKA